MPDIQAVRYTEEYRELRPLLFAIAYRMVGSVSEAEDLVQEAFLRYHARPDDAEVGSPRAYLTTITTRLAIDHLRSARVRREAYVGPWLPEPLVVDAAAGPSEQAELADSLSLAFLVVLERLSPVERAVFLLHDVFDLPYDEIAEIVERSEENCRQLASRARRRVEESRPRFEVSLDHHRELTDRFIHACETGDADELIELLAEDVVAYSDGGGKVAAARRPVEGRERVAKFLIGISRPERRPESAVVERVDVNGRPGVRVAADGTPLGVVSLDVADDGVRAVRIVVNPEKLRHLAT